MDAYIVVSLDTPIALEHAKAGRKGSATVDKALNGSAHPQRCISAA